MIEFVLARYNYWIVIVLMMTGLYIVFSRGNLVKTVIGLNLFQTSVFIFYITMGKIAGGTAPILVGGHDEGEGHGDAGERGSALSPEEAQAYASGERANAAGDLAGADLPSTTGAPGLHDAPVPGNALAPGGPAAHGAADAAIARSQDGIAIVHEEPQGLAEAAGHAADVIYSNPLPHVLILTAIVVGVATTAVGLAIAVRIREAYGTVEEDALEAMDNAAEFGREAPAS